MAFATDLIMSAFYCDATAARILSTQFAQIADQCDEAHIQLRAFQEAAAAKDTVEDDDTIQEAQEVVEPAAYIDTMQDELAEDNSVN